MFLLKTKKRAIVSRGSFAFLTMNQFLPGNHWRGDSFWRASLAFLTLNQFLPGNHWPDKSRVSILGPSPCRFVSCPQTPRLRNWPLVVLRPLAGFVLLLRVVQEKWKSHCATGSASLVDPLDFFPVTCQVQERS